MNSSPLFELYAEVKKNYNDLFPKKEVGLVVFKLYEKIKLGILERNFSHENIIEAIEDTDRELGRVNKNSLPGRNNDIIHKLLKFYLQRNNKGYSLRIFSEDICKLIENELHARFNPSQIEKQFILFHEALLKSIHDEETFSVWYKDIFEPSKNQMKRQIEILHNGVENTIKDLNTLYTKGDVDFISKLREMDAKVRDLSSDTRQLAAAFELSDTITGVINEAYDNPRSFAYNNDYFSDARKELRFFFNELERSLADVSLTVDKIRPQLERLYGSFDQRELDRKLERIVDYLFLNSYVEKNENGKEEIVLPPAFQSRHFPGEKARFQYPYYYDFLAQRNFGVRKPILNESEHQIQFENAHAKILLNQAAVFHFNFVMKQLKKGNQFSYHDFVCELLQNGESIEVAMKTTHLVLRELGNDPAYKIIIKPNFKTFSNNQNFAVWETTFQPLTS